MAKVPPLPEVSGEQFSLLAHGFREYVLAGLDSHEDVEAVLVAQMEWAPPHAAWVKSVLDDGIAVLHPEADDLKDPHAEKFKKATTPVRRKKRESKSA